jgi:predicted amidohydrolase
MPDRLHIAAAQFPVSGDRARNARYIHGQIAQAAKRGTRVILFPETALTGYAPRHLPDLSDYDWEGLQDETDRIASSARVHRVWTIFGTMRRDANGDIRNSLQVVSPAGDPVVAYDKRRPTRSSEARVCMRHS